MTSTIFILHYTLKCTWLYNTKCLHQCNWCTLKKISIKRAHREHSSYLKPLLCFSVHVFTSSPVTGAFPFLTFSIKEAWARWVLKNRFREFSFNFCVCNIQGIPSMGKKFCSETGTISKYVSNIAIFVWNILGKTLLLHWISIFKKTNSWNF